MRWVFISLVMASQSVVWAANTDGPWEKVSHKRGVLVERRNVAGSNLKEFRGSAVLTAPLEHVLAVFTDVEGATEWMDSCKESSLVENKSAREKIVYNRTKAPWPVADRDAVLRNLISVDEQDHRVQLEFVTVSHPNMPTVKKVVRMPFLRGHWYFWPMPDGKTRVEYQVHANPGGQLPAWLVNYVSRELPAKTIAGLELQAKKRTQGKQILQDYPEIAALIDRTR
jgi:hypothetical protein